MKTIQQLAQLALDVQDACNLSGVVHAFSETMTELRAIARADGWEGTDALNRHPIALLFSDKITSLSYSNSPSEHTRAWDWASRIAAGDPLPSRGNEP